MDQYAMLTPHEQLVETLLHKGQGMNVLSRIYGTLCRALVIPSGPLTALTVTDLN